MLRLYGLKLNGSRFIAVVYAIASKGTLYSYLGGFDPEFEDMSPGNLVLERIMLDAIREGCRQFDFLRGREKYKYLWGAADRKTYSLGMRRVAARQAP